MTQVVMPQMGESLAEGTVVKWLKQPGDEIGRDEPLVEISTDKVDTDVPSPVAGILRRILVAEGETVAVGIPLAVIDTGEEEPAVTPPAAAHAPAPEKAEEAGGHFKSAHASQLVSFRRAPTASDAPGAEKARPYSPAVLKTAQQGSVPLQALTSLKGSGRNGRVTKRDVEDYMRAAPAGAIVPSAAMPAPGPAAPSAPPSEYLYRPGEQDRLVPMSVVRKRIAHHMSWSVRISPHASAFTDCDMSRAVEIMKGGERERFAERAGAPLTYTVLAAEALVRALREFPTFNASVVDDALAIKPRINLGIAVAIADSDELVVPVVGEADGMSLTGLARAIADVATRARDRRLRPEDVQGGTFTLTNPGIFGGVTGTPILNQPQVGIIGLGAIAKRAVVVDDEIVARPMMTVALTFDHRANDGMAGFKFLERFRVLLEEGPQGL